MTRFATSVALAGWAGYCAIWSFGLAAGSGLITEAGATGSVALMDGLHLPQLPGLAAADATAFAALLAMLAAGLGLALARLHRGDDAGVSAGERIAAATLVVLIAFQAAASLAGSPAATIFGEGPAVYLTLAGTFAILVFDHLMEPSGLPDFDDLLERELERLRTAAHRAPQNSDGDRR